MAVQSVITWWYSWSTVKSPTTTTTTTILRLSGLCLGQTGSHLSQNKWHIGKLSDLSYKLCGIFASYLAFNKSVLSLKGEARALQAWAASDGVQCCLTWYNVRPGNRGSPIIPGPIQALLNLLAFQYENTQPFYGSVEFVRDNPGEPVPEETFTHYTHRGHQSSLSAFSIYYDTWHPPYSIHVL